MKQGDRGGKPKLGPPMPRKPYHDLLDEIFAKAQADGHFSNLPGEGKPLKFDDDDMVPDEDRLAYRMLKTAGFAPPWVEARRSIDQERAEIARWLADAQRRLLHLDAKGQVALHVAYKRKLTALQGMITNFNLTAPAGVEHLEGVRMAEELAKLSA